MYELRARGEKVEESEKVDQLRKRLRKVGLGKVSASKVINVVSTEDKANEDLNNIAAAFDNVEALLQSCQTDTSNNWETVITKFLHYKLEVQLLSLKDTLQQNSVNLEKILEDLKHRCELIEKKIDKKYLEFQKDSTHSMTHNVSKSFLIIVDVTEKREIKLLNY